MPHRISILPAVLLIVPMLSQCIRQTDPPTNRVSLNDPMFYVDTLEPVRAQALELVKKGEKASWDAQAMARAPIHSVGKLEKILKYYGDMQTQELQARRLKLITEKFHEAHSTVSYHFEGDSSVLVFFDKRGKQISYYSGIDLPQ